MSHILDAVVVFIFIAGMTVIARPTRTRFQKPPEENPEPPPPYVELLGSCRACGEVKAEMWSDGICRQRADAIRDPWEEARAARGKIGD